MLSVDAGGEEAWGDVAVWRPAAPRLPRGRWAEHALAVVAVVAGVMSALRLTEPRARIIVQETRGRGGA